MSRYYKKSTWLLLSVMVAMMCLTACGVTAESDPSVVVIPATPTPEAQANPEEAVESDILRFPKKPSDETAALRVMLSSLDRPVALGITLSGNYSVDGDKGFRFLPDSEIVVAADGENLLLSCGGMTIDMGTSLELVRHAGIDNAKNGFYIHENKYDTIYLGDLRLINEEGRILPIVTIDIDDYLYGVVPFEMSDSFPIEALKAQAVAARTYALARRAANSNRAYDVVDTTADQVFRGLNPEYENAIKAVDDTRYVAGMYNDTYATCYFSASNGGITALPDQIWGYEGDYGYLDMRDDPYDLANQNSVVKTLLIPSEPARLDSGILSRLGEFSRIMNVEPIEPKFDGSHMFTKLRFTMETTTSGDEKIVDLDFYNDLKPNFGLKINSADCEVASVVPREDGFAIESRRFGHGVGMSQRGAQQMAGKEGMDALSILQFYYPGLAFTHMEFKPIELTRIETLPASIGAARPRPTPKPTPAPLPNLVRGEAYAKTKLSTKTSTLNVREQPNTDSKIVGLLANGQRLIVIKQIDEDWAEIKTAELKGYVSMGFLELE